MTLSPAIGVDIGGTKIAFALVSPEGDVLARHRLPTQPEQGVEAVVRRIVAGVHHLERQTDQAVAGVGIGVPGFVDGTHGIVLNAVNLYWRQVPLVDALDQCFGHALPITIGNDVRALALGEMRFGAAQGHNDFVYLAMGTGLGAAAVTSGRLLSGAHFTAMEIGHTVVVPNGRLCGCGQRGCLEQYLSGGGLLAAWHAYRADYPESLLAQQSSISTEAIIQQMANGDPLASRIRNDLVDWLTHALVWCTGILDPSLIVIGGGLGHAAAPFVLDAVRERLNGRNLIPGGQHPHIALSRVADSAVGAACLAWKDR